MTEATWTDLLGTVRLIFTQLPQIIAAVAAIFGGYWAFRSRALGLQNADHLVKQDATIAVVAEAAVIAARASTTDNPDEHLRARVASLADDIATIRRESGPGA
jgi:hypothetical protein